MLAMLEDLPQEVARYVRTARDPTTRSTSELVSSVGDDSRPHLAKKDNEIACTFAREKCQKVKDFRAPAGCRYAPCVTA